MDEVEVEEVEEGVAVVRGVGVEELKLRKKSSSALRAGGVEDGGGPEGPEEVAWGIVAGG